jgi:Leucine-rich repeat (LRR) protein
VPGIASYVAVTSINLESCQLIGELPASIGDFHYLDFFSIGGNYVTGTIPETIGAWNKNMDNIKFFDNSIRGTIPVAIGGLTGLSNLELDQNYMIGSVPDFLSGLKDLKVMHLYDNSLTGPIPEWIGGLSALTRIYWDSNSLTGPIPASIGQLSSLEYLHLFSNSLVGAIPSTLDHLTNLTELALNNNQLVGTIPSLAALTKLFLLDLHANTLTMGGMDEVPTDLFSELTNEGPMNLSSNCLNYPSRGFYPAASCGIIAVPSISTYTHTNTYTHNTTSMSYVGSYTTITVRNITFTLRSPSALPLLCHPPAACSATNTSLPHLPLRACAQATNDCRYPNHSIPHAQARHHQARRSALSFTCVAQSQWLLRRCVGRHRTGVCPCMFGCVSSALLCASGDCVPHTSII